jgi:hypothetical protein
MMKADITRVFIFVSQKIKCLLQDLYQEHDVRLEWIGIKIKEYIQS